MSVYLSMGVGPDALKVRMVYEAMGKSVVSSSIVIMRMVIIGQPAKVTMRDRPIVGIPN